MKRLEFFYDFVCPYAYVASTQVRALAKACNAELVYRPVLLGGIFNHLRGTSDKEYAPNQMNPTKTRINQRDLERYASLFEAPLQKPASHPRRTVLALRAALASGALPEASHALFDAYWRRGEDLEDPRVVEAALSAAGLDGARAVTSAPAQKQALIDSTLAAFEAGVFGVPTFRVDQELYWGQDRLDFVARALDPSRDGWTELDKSARPVASEIEFFFDYSSPFAYLAHTQIAALEAASGVSVKPIPFLLGALFKAVGTGDVPLFTFPESKRLYVAKDIDRFAKRYDVGFRFPDVFPLRSVAPLRLYLAAQAELPGADARRLSDALFSAYWSHNRNISEPQVLAEILGELELPAGLLEAASSDQAKQALRTNTDYAVATGLCGAPTFKVGGELFWGQDRLPMVAHAARVGFPPASSTSP
ncbi:MAG: 2-hydroxychromene-2-carboxylate isomerase [Polyangiaceae bacterium]|nr:2-hydroxychromene-2-carboxylate isomerase [Polyangiaceae bacterium]